jgi:hypothetical protein
MWWGGRSPEVALGEKVDTSTTQAALLRSWEVCVCVCVLWERVWLPRVC